jgi:PIN domain
MIRVVLDANVVVSGVLSDNGVPGRILKAWKAERFHLVSSAAILDELRRVLRYPKIRRYHGWSHAEILEFVEDVARQPCRGFSKKRTSQARSRRVETSFKSGPTLGPPPMLWHAAQFWR